MKLFSTLMSLLGAFAIAGGTAFACECENCPGKKDKDDSKEATSMVASDCKCGDCKCESGKCEDCKCESCKCGEKKKDDSLTAHFGTCEKDKKDEGEEDEKKDDGALMVG